MGVLDKFLDAIKVNEEDDLLDDDLMDEDDDFLDDDMDEKPRKKFFERFSRKQVEEEDELDDFSYDEEEDSAVEEPVSARTTFRSAPKFESKVQTKSTSKAEKSARQSSKITPMRSSRKGTSAGNVEVCVIRPTSMEDTREIADTLMDSSTVILNLEGIDVELAQRIIDFTLGACYSLHGTLQKVSSYIFVLGPSNVDITGDLQNMIGSSAPSVRAGY